MVQVPGLPLSGAVVGSEPFHRSGLQCCVGYHILSSGLISAVLQTGQILHISEKNKYHEMNYLLKRACWMLFSEGYWTKGKNRISQGNCNSRETGQHRKGTQLIESILL